MHKINHIKYDAIAAHKTAIAMLGVEDAAPLPPPTFRVGDSVRPRLALSVGFDVGFEVGSPVGL